MSEARGFCPRCGDPLPSDEPTAWDVDGLGRSLCPSCYFEALDLVAAPTSITIDVCTTCGAIKRDRSWTDPPTNDLTEVAIGAVGDVLQIHRDVADVEWRVEPEQVDANTIRMHCRVVGSINGVVVEESITIPVTISRGTCTRCGRIAGNYFASIVQLRAVDRNLKPAEIAAAESMADDIVSSMQETGDRNAFITETTRNEHGLDVKVSTTKIGRKLSNRLVERFGGTVSDSETLVTEDEDGNEVYRVTYAVHLPPFGPGNVIQPADSEGPVLVKSTKGAVRGTRLLSGEPYRSSYEEGERPDAVRIGSIDDAEWTTVVAIEDEHSVQLIDPHTFESVTVTRPSFFDPDVETVPVLKAESGLYILPPAAVERE